MWRISLPQAYANKNTQIIQITVEVHIVINHTDRKYVRLEDYSTTFFSLWIQKLNLEKVQKDFQKVDI